MRSNFKGNASRSYGLLLFSTFLGICLVYNVKSYSSKIIRKCLNKNIEIGKVCIYSWPWSFHNYFIPYWKSFKSLFWIYEKRPNIFDTLCLSIGLLCNNEIPNRFWSDHFIKICPTILKQSLYEVKSQYPAPNNNSKPILVLYRLIETKMAKSDCFCGFQKC